MKGGGDRYYKKHLKIIEEYVNDNYFDKEKLLKYIETRTVAGNEVFSYISNDYENWYLWFETNNDSTSVLTY